MSPRDFEGALFDCLRAPDEAVTLDRLKGLSEPEWAALIKEADEQLVGPMLRHRLLSPRLKPFLPDQVRQVLVAEQRRIALVNLRIHREFHQVALALRGHGIPVMPLKGLHLASLVYPDLGIRTMGDIDLLVPATDLARAGTALQALGYEPLYPYTVSQDPVPYSFQHLPRFIKPGATTVEIHWHVVGAEATLSVDVRELWERAVPARVAGVDVKVLCPEDLLLHLCVHATCHHFCEFSARPWCDIAETIHRYAGRLSWETVMARAGSWRGRRGTYLALQLARNLLGAAVPDEVLRFLRPAAFDDRMLAVAMRQRHRVRMPIPAAQFAAERGLLAKLRALWRGAFPSKDRLADEYNIRRSSPFVYRVYAMRLRDLVKRYWRAAIGINRTDPTLVADTVALQDFLAEE